MWTGDMQSGYPTQWALNPSAYQNLSNDQVDWASLAQQWIKMKETFPADQVPPAPPPPPIKLTELPDVEGGEAPMDMSKDDAAPPDGANWSTWDSWQQWGWNWSGSGPAPSVPTATTAAVPTVAAASSKVAAIPAVPPYTYNQANTVPSFPADPTNSFDYNHGSTIPDQFSQQNYWSEPAPFIRGSKNADWRNDRSGVRHKSSKSDEEEDSTTTIDAAKRKQLPAWIREGLEKMEREKQKKIERERMLKEREEEMSRRRTEENQAAQQMNSGIPPKSRFDSDSEDSEKDGEEVPVKSRKSRFHDPGSPPHNQEPLRKASPSPPPQRFRTKEQIMQDVMLKVRNILTEILMSVTNDEMHSIVDETMASFRAKAPAMQLRKTPALTSLTGKLGLGIYDSETDASEKESEDEASAQENGVDSDQELKERIIRRKQEFVRIEREIENRIREQEERERRQILLDDAQEEDEEEVEQKDVAQVEANHSGSGNKLELQEKEPVNDESQSNVGRDDIGYQTSERSNKSVRDSSEERTKSSSRDSSESSRDSYSRSRSRSRSSSSSRYKKSQKSSRRRKDKKISKRKRKRSLSRESDWRKSSHRKSSRDRRRDDKRRKERSRSRDNRRYSDYNSSRRRRSPSHHRSPSYHRSSSYESRHRSSSRHRSPTSHHFSIVSYSASRKRRHRSHSSSPEVSRGKRSSHRSRD